MKVLIIIGSYHRQGMSFELVESFKRGLLKTEPQVEIKVINLLDLTVQFCTGTSVCAKKDGKPIGDCVLKDGMEGVLKEMVACDRLVLATPIYWMTQTALMQRFLERCLPLLSYGPMGPKPRNPKKTGKKGLAIVSTGAPFPFNVIMGFTCHAVKMLSATCEFCGCSQVLALKAGGMERDLKAKKRFIQQAFGLGVKLGHKE
jgi:multimeric flavodoxin WrbA